MKIVLDTNVVVSALISPRGTPAEVVEIVLDGRVALYADRRIADEYRAVFLKYKWPFDIKEALLLVDELMERSVLIHAAPLNIALPDPDDLIFIETAVAAGADAIVTGNKKHFPARAARGIPVLSPAEFIELVRRTNDGKGRRR
jgi:uncharacterized protein